ncbi:glycerol-3-phosphate dehydrogenase, anaerobic, A subunit [Desulfosporosinus orientis DSM 765]|uniref:glycerol-3-phosphate dehydrogenase n=1 Tax=Desulfosporosinus orientis (strain ATCC 19365 / DSM 765 / NCIMB 8382 / VKM B-1628 / Singapore I) TaxID=768706 RepID=G7WGA7_DESOD|nr:anaerobic glycerol-3-phosphate dehydrogenase subunit GlpA [Desulfosporosinus orientis]AET70839.1 glycerol-3-phosphate dehydrogenase, anaerobic, A subunit [Desulfosporosinus orientis DSM 765]
MIDYQVVIVGGGATGVGILRDLSMRGISALLLEQGDLAHGTSSRFHGLLHSGARYAVKDSVSAAECIAENLILKQIAAHCIADTGGWFVQSEEDDSLYVEQWLKGCGKANIPIRELSLAEAYVKEPLLKSVSRVFEVPDATVDGFKLVWANAKSAKHYGGEYKTYHQVQSLIMESGKVVGVKAKDLTNGEEVAFHSEVVVNASGAWAAKIAASIGVTLEVICDKGTLLAFNHRLFQRVINRLHLPSDGDIFVPHETITILGTTSEIVDSPQDNQPKDDEVKRLLSMGGMLLPNIINYRVIRAFAGVRPLHRDDSKLPGSAEAGREVSRNFALIDHEAQDGVQGLISIVGGKFTTYRLMAEKVSDWVADKLGNKVPCRTAQESLLPEIPKDLRQQALRILPSAAAEKMLERLGDDAKEVIEKIKRDPSKAQMLCECEMVSAAEIEKVAADPDSHHLADIRRKTRLGMGTCQGAFCTYRVLPLLRLEKQKFDPIQGELRSFINQRWKGIRPVLWGQQLRETELTRAIYAGTLQLNENQR